MKTLGSIYLLVKMVLIAGLSACGSDSSDDESPYSSYTPYQPSSTSSSTSSTSSTSTSTYTPYDPPYSSTSTYGSDTCVDLWSMQTQTNYKCIAIPVTVSLGDENGFLSINGGSVASRNINQTILAEIRRARQNAGDREWASHLDEPTFYPSLQISQDSKTIASLYSYTGRSTISFDSTNMKLVTSGDDARPTITIKAKLSSEYCVVLTGDTPVIPKTTTSRVVVNVRQLTSNVYKQDCKSPLTDLGGVSILTKLIARGASKSDISAIMGTTSLTIASSVKWSWHPPSSPACAGSIWEECSVTFDSAGKVTATKGIKGAYLELSTW
jgi:hypothetical protein